jgi:pilus assembly protein CpaF
MHEVFTFEQTGVTETGDAEGHFKATGIHPQCLDRLERAGVQLPLSMFARGPLEGDRYDAIELSNWKNG